MGRSGNPGRVCDSDQPPLRLGQRPIPAAGLERRCCFGRELTSASPVPRALRGLLEGLPDGTQRLSAVHLNPGFCIWLAGGVNAIMLRTVAYGLVMLTFASMAALGQFRPGDPASVGPVPRRARPCNGSVGDSSCTYP